MSNTTDLLIDDLIAECDRFINKWQMYLNEANGAYTRGLYQGKIESYQELKKSLLKKKSDLG